MMDTSKVEAALADFFVRIGQAEEALEEIVYFDDKIIAEAQKEQIRLELRWQRLLAEAKGHCDDLEFAADSVYGQVYKTIQTTSQIALNTTDIKFRVDGDENYRAIRGLANRAKRYRDRVQGAISVLETRKYSLNNLSKLIIAGAEKQIL